MKSSSRGFRLRFATSAWCAIAVVLSASGANAQFEFNDDCADAVAFGAIGDGTHPADTLINSASGVQALGLPPYLPGVPNTACEHAPVGDLFIDMWYCWQAGASGDYTITTCGTVNFDSKIALYSGTCSSLTPISCDDDGPGCWGFTAELLASGIVAGDLYYIQIGGFDFTEMGFGEVTIVNTGPDVTNFCGTSPNSVGAGASMSFTGSNSVAANDLTLACGPIAAGEPGIFFHAPTPTTNPIGFPFGEGRQCIMGSLVRLLPPTSADGSGVMSRLFDNTHPFQAMGVVVGQTRYFQAWYRDPNAGDIDGDGVDEGFNLSDGLRVTFVP